MPCMTQNEESRHCHQLCACSRRNELARLNLFQNDESHQGYTPIGECGRYRYNNQIETSLLVSFQEEAEASGYRFRLHPRCQ
jgi:hypothetical protein